MWREGVVVNAGAKSQSTVNAFNANIQGACSLVDAGAGLDWLVLVFCERKTLLAGWFGLAETNKHQ